jgi:predicted RNA-binding Zn ribbon-like protein
LDFVNTVDERLAPAPDDSLGAYADLLIWSQRVGILSAKHAQRLSRLAVQQPRAAQKVWARAIALREALYRILTARLEGKPLKRADLTRFNRELKIALAHARLAPSTRSLEWEWNGQAFDQMLWPLVCSAAELLTSAKLARVHQCANHTCGWLFLDTSRSGRRRWCTMRYCGNRAKAHRYYARSRAHRTRKRRSGKYC